MVYDSPYQLTDDTDEEDPGDDPDVGHGDGSVLVRVSRSSEVLCLRPVFLYPVSYPITPSYLPPQIFLK